MSVASPETDEALARLSLFETWRFGILVERYEHKLRRYLSRLGNFSEDDLDDLLQNIFIKVYQNLNGFDDSLKFSSWIYRIAHNEAISFFRHNQARPQGHLAEVSEEVFSNILSDTDVEAEFRTSEIKDTAVKTVDELPDKYREIVILYYFEHKSYEEISDILRLPLGTVSVRLRRAKAKLRQVLEANGYENE